MAACGWALRTGCSVAARSENVGSGGGTPALEESLCMRYVWTGMATFGSARRATGLVASTRGPAESSGSTRLTAPPRWKYPCALVTHGPGWRPLARHGGLRGWSHRRADRQNRVVQQGSRPRRGIRIFVGSGSIAAALGGDRGRIVRGAASREAFPARGRSSARSLLGSRRGSVPAFGGQMAPHLDGRRLGARYDSGGGHDQAG